MPMTRLLSIALSAAFVSAVGWASAALSQVGEAQEVLHGRQLFMSNNCYLCHGTVGQGGAGPTIAPPRLPPQSGFSAYVRHPAGRMPPYTQAVLSDADLGAIYDYLQSLPPPQQVPRLLSGTSAAGGN
jgi:ubiquinol-cytochrome c reductase cytochrome c subunit